MLSAVPRLLLSLGHLLLSLVSALGALLWLALVCGVLTGALTVQAPMPGNSEWWATGLFAAAIVSAVIGALVKTRRERKSGRAVLTD